MTQLAAGYYPGLPETRLLAAIVTRAWRDVVSRQANLALDALAYIDGPNFDEDCQWLNINPDRFRGRVQEKLMPQTIFTPDEVAAIHRRYLNDHIAIEKLAAEYHVVPATLYRSFAAAGLPTRRRGRIKAQAPAPAGDELRHLTQTLAGLVDATNVKTVRVTIEFDLVPDQDPS